MSKIDWTTALVKLVFSSPLRGLTDNNHILVNACGGIHYDLGNMCWPYVDQNDVMLKFGSNWLFYIPTLYFYLENWLNYSLAKISLRQPATGSVARYGVCDLTAGGTSQNQKSQNQSFKEKETFYEQSGLTKS